MECERVSLTTLANADLVDETKYPALPTLFYMGVKLGLSH